MPVTRTRDKVIYSGTVAIPLLQLNTAIVLPGPMPDANYDIYWMVPNIAVGVSIMNQTVNGFTVVLGASTAMTFKWAAVEKVTI